MLMNVRIPHQTFNAAVKNGTAGAKLKKVLDATKPEAIYFTEQNGLRTAVVIVDLPDTSKIPALVEPWFLTFDASIHIHPVMLPEDLKRAGLDAIGKKWK